jgi:glycerophosphoryl diester phosphodiesterase
MTFRVKPVDRARSDRDPSRRTLYMNIGFGIAVVVAVLILVAVGVTTWYGAHLAPAASVAGQTITKDQFNDRAAVEHCHAAGLEVNTWTCDDPVLMAEMIEWGVDGICTNVPDVAIRVRGHTR